jgi:hypothetical protein
VWIWKGLGDLWRTTGSLERAAEAYQNALRAAQRTGDERDLSVSQNKIGELLVAQGEREQACGLPGRAGNSRNPGAPRPRQHPMAARPDRFVCQDFCN